MLPPPFKLSENLNFQKKFQDKKNQMQHPTFFNISQIQNPLLNDQPKYSYLISQIQQWNQMTDSKRVVIDTAKKLQESVIDQLHKCLTTIFGQDQSSAIQQLNQIYDWYLKTIKATHELTHSDPTKTFYSPRSYYSDFMTNDTMSYPNQSEFNTFYPNMNETSVAFATMRFPQKDEKNKNILNLNQEQDLIMMAIDQTLQNNRQKDLQEYRLNQDMTTSMQEWTKSNSQVKQKILHKRNTLELKQMHTFHNPEHKKKLREEIIKEDYVQDLLKKFEYTPKSTQQMTQNKKLIARQSINMHTPLNQQSYENQLCQDPIYCHIKQLRQINQNQIQRKSMNYRMSNLNQLKFNQREIQFPDPHDQIPKVRQSVQTKLRKSIQDYDYNDNFKKELNTNQKIHKKLKSINVQVDQNDLLNLIKQPKKIIQEIPYATSRNSELVMNPFFVEKKVGRKKRK